MLHLSLELTIFVNPNWVSISTLAGSGYFSGLGVVGNVFTPPGIGTWTICYNYTDSLGCTASVCNTINVIFCCDTTFNINAGNDTTICAGGIAVLNATGCNGSVTWYQMGVEGPFIVGQDPVFDALPQTTTCYMVVCCNPLYPACCDTDTVCVYVNPHPVLAWPTMYPSICNNSGPITLDSADVLIAVFNS